MAPSSGARECSTVMPTAIRAPLERASCPDKPTKRLDFPRASRCAPLIRRASIHPNPPFRSTFCVSRATPTHPPPTPICFTADCCGTGYQNDASKGHFGPILGRPKSHPKPPKATFLPPQKPPPVHPRSTPSRGGKIVADFWLGYSLGGLYGQQHVLLCDRVTVCLSR